MIREAIKAQTAQAHKDTEKVSFSDSILDHSLNLEQYKLLIQNHYSLTTAWEGTWDDLSFNVPDSWKLEDRKKKELISWDMDHLGLEPMDVYQPKFQVNTPAAFLGSLYVFEGSTLGGSVIYRHLRQNPNLSEVSDFKFYKGYEKETGPMWKQFLESLQQVTEPKEVETAIEAAQHTFGEVKQVFLASQGASSIR